MPDALVTTDRILLLSLTAEDQAEFLASVAASRELHHPWIDAADTPARFAQLLERAAQPEFEPFVVRGREDGVLSGAINISNIIRGPFQSAFVGYWAFAGREGRGHLSDGLRAVVRHAFTTLGLHRLEANIQPANTGSIALAERCGFRFEGFSPSYLQVLGDWRDHNRYAITQEGWEAPGS